LKKSLKVAGRDLTLETGRLARQAGGAVLVEYGDTMVLVTATSSAKPREGIDFFPLTVDYEERLYAVGRIPGGFIKREGRPTEKAILSARLIDRPIRPLFPKGYRNDVHVVATVFSVDQDNPQDIAAIIGASAALTISAIPFNGPIGAVSVGLVDDQIVINPTLKESEKSRMKLSVAGTRDAVMMVEAGAQEVPEAVMIDAITAGHAEIQRIVDFINDFQAEALELGLAKAKTVFTPEEPDPDLADKLRQKITQPLDDLIRRGAQEKWAKQVREQALAELKERLISELTGEDLQDHDPGAVGKLFGDIFMETEKKLVRRMVIADQLRVDGRKPDEVRPIWCQVGVLKRPHGSGLFTRGETQVLTVATLGPISDEQILDGLGVEETKRYMHHYNFPPYSVGETRPMRGPGRREIGHGALAERALEAVLPSEDQFPYAIRLVSEVIGSNGSTSMGSTCGSTLALMDAGVPIKKPVAGVAMGLVKDDSGLAVLTDIQGVEDALGDMDFKVAGTEAGITALQMDIKIAGIDRQILERAMTQARAGRMHIMQKMLEALPGPRTELSPFAPRIIKTSIHPDKIRDIIGPGGKIIKKIIEETGAQIDIEDDGRVFIYGSDQEAGEKALAIIQGITQEIEVGKIYSGTVTRTTDFGAFVEVVPGVIGLPGKEGLVHISQLEDHRVNTVEDVVRRGDKILVKAIGFDQQGRLKLSRREALNSNQDGETDAKNPAPKNNGNFNHKP